MKKVLLLILVLVASQAYLHFPNLPYSSAAHQVVSSVAPALAPASDETIANAFKNHLDKVTVKGSGVVKKILPDDTTGAKHQRFIIHLKSGHSLLIVHNISKAPRIATLAVGDTVDFFGEYIWNDRGGLIHWTHASNTPNHVSGWLKHAGKTYQ